MLCKKCNSEMIKVSTKENHQTGNITREYICMAMNCQEIQIELACVREATEKEREEILSEFVGLSV